MRRGSRARRGRYRGPGALRAGGEPGRRSGSHVGPSFDAGRTLSGGRHPRAGSTRAIWITGGIESRRRAGQGRAVSSLRAASPGDSLAGAQARRGRRTAQARRGTGRLYGWPGRRSVSRAPSGCQSSTRRWETVSRAFRLDVEGGGPGRADRRAVSSLAGVLVRGGRYRASGQLRRETVWRALRLDAEGGGRVLDDAPRLASSTRAVSRAGRAPRERGIRAALRLARRAVIRCWPDVERRAASTGRLDAGDPERGRYRVSPACWPGAGGFELPGRFAGRQSGWRSGST